MRTTIFGGVGNNHERGAVSYRGESEALVRMNSRGFTLIELLVVIAIISILAAIIFPVFARAKDGAYRSADITNMNALRTALQQYRADQGAYPPALLGYIGGYDGTLPAQADIVPANQLQAFLYPRRVDSVETFRPANNRGTNLNNQVVMAGWPLGQAPQRFRNFEDVSSCFDDTPFQPVFYKVSGYDVAPTRPEDPTRWALRYTLFWSELAVPAEPCLTAPGGANDSPRQLGYTDPPEDTVITWNSFFRDYDTAGNPTRPGKRDIVLFLGGAARPMDSVDVAERSWQVRP